MRSGLVGVFAPFGVRTRVMPSGLHSGAWAVGVRPDGLPVWAGPFRRSAAGSLPYCLAAFPFPPGILLRPFSAQCPCGLVPSHVGLPEEAGDHFRSPWSLGSGRLCRGATGRKVFGAGQSSSRGLPGAPTVAGVPDKGSSVPRVSLPRLGGHVMVEGGSSRHVLHGGHHGPGTSCFHKRALQ